MPRSRALMLDSRFGGVESWIYRVAEVLLIVAAGFGVVGTVEDVLRGSGSRPVTDTAVFILERILLLFIIAELLHTLRLFARGGAIVVEPFLFIGLIAVVRRILVITAEVETVQGRRAVEDFLTQIGALAGLVLVLALSIRLLRNGARRGDDGE
jgi:uncharacterized membrane protein (DUF373 family)